MASRQTRYASTAVQVRRREHLHSLSKAELLPALGTWKRLLESANDLRLYDKNVLNGQLAYQKVRAARRQQRYCLSRRA